MNSSELLGRILAATGSKATFRHTVWRDGESPSVDIDITREFFVDDVIDRRNFVTIPSYVEVSYSFYPFATSYEAAVEGILDEFAFAPVPAHLIDLRYVNGKLRVR